MSTVYKRGFIWCLCTVRSTYPSYVYFLYIVYLLVHVFQVFTETVRNDEVSYCRMRDIELGNVRFELVLSTYLLLMLKLCTVFTMAVPFALCLNIISKNTYQRLTKSRCKRQTALILASQFS